jgi:Tol biopolymer transport system component
VTARQPDRIAIAISERGDTGARLVAIDEHGDRMLELVRPAATIARDTNPAISPDGRWIVFASSRGRSLDQTSLWIAPLAPEATAVALGTPIADAIDSHPIWKRDGSGIVFASTRGGHGFDLYEVAVASGRATSEPRALTSAPGHEVTPSIAADGSIVYGSITPLPDGQVESHLESRAPDGTITKLTAGPADTSPAVSPDGTTIAFARPVEHKGVPDAELWVVKGGDAHPLVDLPLTDESGPVWSRDGRFVFATSVLRGVRGNVVFSSVIVIDTRERHPIARMLQDRTGAIARLTPAIATSDLDAKALDADPEYLPELARITAAAIAAQHQDPPK